MSKHLSIIHFVCAVALLDLLLIGVLFYSGANTTGWLSAHLPGTFGPGLGAHMTGNHLLCALVVMLNAVLFLGMGVAVLIVASRDALLIGGSGLSRLLGRTAGLSQEDIAATSFAVAEEQKEEIRGVDTGKRLVWIGAVLLLLAFPAVCFTFTQADVKGAPLLVDAGGSVANAAVTIEDAVVFAADQLADAVLLDAPRIFQWHLTSLQPGHNHHWLRPFVLLYHILSKLVVLASLFAAWRTGHLRAYVLAMAGPEAVAAVSSLRAATSGFAEQPSPPAPTGGFAHESAPVAYQALAPVVHSPAPEIAEPHAAPEEASIPAVEEPPVMPQPVEHAVVEEEPAAVAEPVAEPAPVEAPQAETPAIPVYVEHREPPAALSAPVPHAEEPKPDAPVLEAADNHESEAPLALHELRTPANDLESDDGLSRVGELAYKNTALHLTQPEFDA